MFGDRKPPVADCPGPEGPAPLPAPTARVLVGRHREVSPPRVRASGFGLWIAVGNCRIRMLGSTHPVPGWGSVVAPRRAPGSRGGVRWWRHGGRPVPGRVRVRHHDGRPVQGWGFGDGYG